MAWTQFLCPQSPYLFRCGVLHRLFQLRYFHNLLTDKRNQLHTFFVYINQPFGELGWRSNNLIMKRHLIILAVALMLGGTLLSCNKDDSAGSNGNNTSSVTQNPLAGTLWEEDDDTPLHMEFVDNTTVTVWGNFAKEDTGTYRISGNTVTFSSLNTTGSGKTTYKYLNGTFSSHRLTVKWEDENGSQFSYTLYKK